MCTIGTIFFFNIVTKFEKPLTFGNECGTYLIPEEYWQVIDAGL